MWQKWINKQIWRDHTRTRISTPLYLHVFILITTFTTVGWSFLCWIKKTNTFISGKCNCFYIFLFSSLMVLFAVAIYTLWIKLIFLRILILNILTLEGLSCLTSFCFNSFWINSSFFFSSSRIRWSSSVTIVMFNKLASISKKERRKKERKKVFFVNVT